MLRTAAHCVRVLTLPIENSMLVRWRTYRACRQFLRFIHGTCADILFKKLPVTLNKNIYSSISFESLWLEECNGTCQHERTPCNNERACSYVSELVCNWAHMFHNERKQFFEQLNTFESKSAKIVFPFAHHWASLLINERVYLKLCIDS